MNDRDNKTENKTEHQATTPGAELTVSQVAKLARVSVRALHHYDEIGLLQPSGRSQAGYRLYSGDDLARLQQILFFRALELPLGEIQRIMTDPQFDVLAALRLQREMLVEKVAHAHGLITAVEAAITNLEEGKPMKPSEMFEAWKDFDPTQYEAEAEQRWGHTEAFKESKRRTARYTKADWEQNRREASAVTLRLAELMDAGVAPEDPVAMDAAEAHRAYITRWFYPCPPALHRGLGELYVNDPRFTANIDKVRAGLSAYSQKVFAANATRMLARETDTAG